MLVASCSAGSQESEPEPVASPTAAAATPGTAPAPTDGPETTAPSSTTTTTEPAPDVLVDIVDVTLAPLVEADRRASLGGADTTFWPDGNIGSVDLGDGRTTFFAANGSVTARTAGTPTSPADELLDASIVIDGVADEFAYAAGGPVYFDAGTGSILMWYHAERYMLDDPANFHAAIGLARSGDGGATFVNLGIIIETNSEPDPFSPCCADVGGAAMIVRDGTFFVYFRDRIASDPIVDVQLARASAPVEEVLAAAARGETSAWTKYDNGTETPGLGGTSSALEASNPKTSWFDVAWHEDLQRYVMVIALHEGLTDRSEIRLATSTDGLNWSPRQLLSTCNCELTYPSFLATSGPERVIDDAATIVFVATDPISDFRWQRTDVRIATVEFSGGFTDGRGRQSVASDERVAFE